MESMSSKALTGVVQYLVDGFFNTENHRGMHTKMHRECNI